MSKEEDTPFGIILIATYFILIGVYFLSINSMFASVNQNNNFFLITVSIIGIIFIILGWAILLQKKWAYYVTIIMSLCSIFLVMINGNLSISASFAIITTNLIIQIIILIYLFSKPELFGIKPQNITTNTNIQQRMNYRYCLKCGRSVPIDSKFCPYCTKKMQE